MSVGDALGAIGEMVSWICFVLGVPLLLATGVSRIVDGMSRATEVRVVAREVGRFAHWSINGVHYDRLLTDAEVIEVRGSDVFSGYVRRRHPQVMSVQRRSDLTRLLSAATMVFFAFGFIGLAMSWIPVFL